MKIKFLIILFFALTMSIGSLYAQTDSTNVSYYFDDGRNISDGKSIFKIDLLSMIAGDVPIIYERIFGESFGLEVGIGILLPTYIASIDDDIFNGVEFKDREMGYSLRLHPKQYFHRTAPEENFISALYIRRVYHVKNNPKIENIISFNFGGQYMFGSNFVFEYCFGLGAKFRNEISPMTDSKLAGAVMPISFKIGFII